MDLDYSLSEKCYKGIIKNYISLGHNCFVATELEQMGLRSCSMPFDWNRTKWKAIVSSFENEFKGFLEYEKLFQKRTAPHVYKNLDYGIGFFHDFNAYRPLKYQLKSVEKKYRRRIKRFFRYISSPTLFIRYCMDKAELDDIASNYSSIEKMIKSYNADNEIAYISHDRIKDEQCSIIKNIFYIEKKPDEELNEHPISSSHELFDILNNADYPSREINYLFEKKKNSGLKYHIKRRIKKLKTKRLRKRRIYVHFNQC